MRMMFNILSKPLEHELFAFTEILPDAKVNIKDKLIESVPWPDVIVTPVGTVHVYEIAPGTAVIE